VLRGAAMWKSTIGLFAMTLPTLWAQAADRAASAAPQPNDGFLVKTLVRVLGPADAKPQTARQRFHDFWMNTAGPVPIIGEAAGAGLGQWENSPREWGQGGSGFGKRFASNMAYNAVRNTISYGAGELFHEDNRYFASGKEGVKARVAYALVSPAIARHRDGRRTVSISGLAGIAGAASISLAWSPPSWQGGKNVAENFGLTYAGTVGVNIVREFVPDLVRRLRK
jgi:hypothetical protein